MRDKTCCDCVIGVCAIEGCPCDEYTCDECYTVVEFDKVVHLVEDLLDLADKLIQMLPDDIEFEEGDENESDE